MTIKVIRYRSTVPSMNLYLLLQGITAEERFTRFTGYGIKVTSKGPISTNAAKLITLITLGH